MKDFPVFSRSVPKFGLTKSQEFWVICAAPWARSRFAGHPLYM
jgi:hypothetical protein